jgi:hypothetical protein
VREELQLARPGGQHPQRVVQRQQHRLDARDPVDVEHEPPDVPCGFGVRADRLDRIDVAQRHAL